jgi:hypothetical protein
MKGLRLYLAALATFTLIGCGAAHRPPTIPVGPSQPPQVVQPPAPEERTLAVIDTPPATDVQLLLAGQTKAGVTNADGYLAFQMPIGDTVQVTAKKEGYDSVDEPRTVPTKDNANISVKMKLSAAPPATDAELHHVLANFCNLTDRQGRVEFTPYYISLPANERKQWLEDQRNAGSTHFVLSPEISYPGSPIPDSHLYGDPQKFVAFVREVMREPSATGRGFVPIIILDSGDKGIKDRIAKFWPGIRAALGDDVNRVIIVAGWELVNASDVTSAEYSFSLKTLHDEGYPHIWAHLAPGRASFSSNPVEADDPWQGAESGAWKSNGGEFVEGFLYQSQAVRPNDDRCDPADGDCWLNRWEDVVPRLGNGMNGWRIVHLAYFEGPAYFYYKKQSDSAFAIRIANAAKQMCDKYHVVCGFGNGIPDGKTHIPLKFTLPILPMASHEARIR